jgi:putative transposase
LAAARAYYLLEQWGVVRADVSVQKRRDEAAAMRLFRGLLRSNPVPRKIVTDQLRSCPAAKAAIHELAQVKHVFIKDARCTASAMFVARRRFSHDSARSGSTSRCPQIT